MAEDAGAIGLPLGDTGVETRVQTYPPSPPGLFRLALTSILIAIGAIAFASLLAVCFVLLLYVRDGTDAITEFYQEFRFDQRLKTLVSAVVVGALYVGVAISTIATAIIHARADWPAVVAWAPMRGSRRSMLLIFAAALCYGVGATLLLSITRSHRLVVIGNTDLALLATLAANLILLAPVAEELFFRGWLYTGLRARFLFWPSFLLTAALFAAIHLGAGNKRILLVLPLAAALGALREVTGSIKPTIALHAIYNLVIVVLTLLES